jgi:hypothetical protein
VAIGEHPDILSLVTNGGNFTIGLNGTADGVGTPLETALNFGTIPFGTTKTLPLMLHNLGEPGSPTVTLTPNGPSYKVVPGSNCLTTGIAMHQVCTVYIEFDPVIVGEHPDILTITPSVGPVTTLPLTGAADGIGVEVETPLNFGAISFGTSKTLPLTVFNRGLPGTQTVSFASNDPSYTVLPGSSCVTPGIGPTETCTVQVKFDPLSPGVHNGILTLTPTRGAAPSTVELEGSTTIGAASSEAIQAPSPIAEGASRELATSLPKHPAVAAVPGAL